MPIARKKQVSTDKTTEETKQVLPVETEGESEKVSLDMLRKAEIVEENTMTEEKETDYSFDNFKNIELVDETPELNQSIEEENAKIEPEIKVVDSVKETEVTEKFKKFQDNQSDVKKLKSQLEALIEKSQQIESENSKLKMEIEALRRALSESQSAVIQHLTRQKEEQNQISHLKAQYEALNKNYQSLTEAHKEAIIKNNADIKPSLPTIEEKTKNL